VPADLTLAAGGESGTARFRNPDQGGNATLFQLRVSKTGKGGLLELWNELCQGFRRLMCHFNKITKYNQYFSLEKMAIGARYSLLPFYYQK
jgi:hypothetical protein